MCPGTETAWSRLFFNNNVFVPSLFFIIPLGYEAEIDGLFVFQLVMSVGSASELTVSLQNYFLASQCG